MQVLGRSWADAGQLQTCLHHSEAWSRPREARPKTTDWEPVSGQRLGRTLEVPGLGACKKLADNRGPCCQPTLCSWAGAWQRLGRSLEVPGLGRAGQMLRVSGWRFWEDLVRCWPNVFNLGALPVPCQDKLFWRQNRTKTQCF